MNAQIKAEDITAAVNALAELVKRGPDPAEFTGYFAQRIANARRAGYEQGIADANKLEKLGGT
jgi:hypothetical protein